MNSSVPTIIVKARLASVATTTATTRSASTSPTRTKSDKRSTETMSSLGQIIPNSHHLREALRFATDRKVLRAPSTSRRLPPVLPPKPPTSTLQASRIASRITTRRCLSRKLQSDGSWIVETVTCKNVCGHSTSPETSSQPPMMARNTAAAVRVSRTKLRCRDVDNLDSGFTKNKDHHSSASEGGMTSGAAASVNDWPPLQAVAQEVLSEMTKERVAEPRLSDADLREAIQLLMEKRAREQQQQQERQQKGEHQKQKQPLTASGFMRPRKSVAQREVEMACGFGDGLRMSDGGGGGGVQNGRLRLIVCIAKLGGASTESLEQLEDKPEQPPPPPMLETVEKFKAKLPHSEPSIVLQRKAAKDNLMHAKLNLLEDDDGLSLPGVELWRDSSSCVHNAEVLEPETAALMTKNLAVGSQAEPPHPRASKLLIGLSLWQSLRYSIDSEKMNSLKKELWKEEMIEETSSVDEKMHQLQQELVQEWQEQNARDFKGDIAFFGASEEGNIKSNESEDVSTEVGTEKNDKNSDYENEFKAGAEMHLPKSGRSSIRTACSRDSSAFSMFKMVSIANMQKEIPGGGQNERVAPKSSTNLPGLGNTRALDERRSELKEHLSRIEMPIISCPAAVIGHLEDHSARTELAKELVMNLQPADDQLVVVQTLGATRRSLKLRQPLRLNQYRRCSEVDELDRRSEDSSVN